jgi:leucyl/phenylalanyl-tRNA---protein transferase
MAEEALSFMAHLKECHVFKMASIYAVAVRVLIQATDAIFPNIRPTHANINFVFVSVLPGFPVAVAVVLVLSRWFIPPSKQNPAKSLYLATPVLNSEFMSPPDLDLFWIPPNSTPVSFPDVSSALHYPNGLLAVGGDLSPERLLYAYSHGIFPWYSEGQPILWWSPDPRTALFPDQMHISRSLRRQLHKGNFIARFDSAFAAVMTGCAGFRPKQAEGGTWITSAMQQAYQKLHRLGYAHSLEIIMDGELAGGLYGIALGGVFFGESMFSRRANASKIALVCLARQLGAWGFRMIDCQVHSEHLVRLGSISMPRTEFLQLLQRYTQLPEHKSPWRLEVLLEF